MKPEPTEDRTTIEATAAAWLGMRDGGLSAAQDAELARWLEADPRHAEIFAELAETWTMMDRLGNMRPPGDAPPDPTLLAPRRSPWSRRWLPLGGLAAAAAITVLLWLNPTSHPATPAVEETVAQSAATEVGGLRVMTLPDGSTVRLNTDSAVEVSYSAAARRVRLVRGEAHFAVAKNPARPFIVSAGKVDVKAVGTAFNVRLRAEDVEVLVTEGKVHVDDSVKGVSALQPRGDAATPLLVAGERVVIRTTIAIVTPAAVEAVGALEVERAMAWQERRLEFASVPLAEVAAEFNRYNRHQLVIADAKLGAQRFGGTFRADGYEALVHLLEQDFGVIVERREQQTVLRLKP